MRYKVVLSYKGSSYSGWQKQINALSVQEKIETALCLILNSKTSIHGSGRTDAGVHALGQVFHFDSEKTLIARKTIHSLNKLLPDDINIISINKVSDAFHARFSAKKKRYSYYIKMQNKDPFFFDRALLINKDLKLASVRKLAKLFVGSHNFANFTSKETDKNNFIRSVYKVSVSKIDDMMKITFEGNGFMRGQVRIMVGSILAVVSEKERQGFIEENLKAKTRQIIGHKAPAHGLYLEKVFY